MDNLKPEWCKKFNSMYPISGSPMYMHGKIYTIRGDSDGKINQQGAMGELYIGWHELFLINKTDSDGLVPYNSSVINGAIHIGDFKYDHQDIVRKLDVAERAAQYLPEFA